MNTAIHIENVSKKLGRRQVLKTSLSMLIAGYFRLSRPNGAGKTTTIRILLGLLEADSENSTSWGRIFARLLHA